MTAQFQYTRLEHQAKAVQAISDVLADVRFIAPLGIQANPHYATFENRATLVNNINAIRAAAGIKLGAVDVATTRTPALSLDVLMETGTGKTFTFIETVHRLHQQHKLSKFIILVPSNAIRQGTLKSLQTTAAFFAREYNNQKINVCNYSERTVTGFINAANAGISVMVATFQSFAGEKKVMNRRGVEANLFGHAKSYMEALAAIRPVLIIDEPHRFTGSTTLEYLAKFDPLLTLRFGATFKDDDFRNLIYTLDSLEAFRQRLVKGISVDTVGAADAGVLGGAAQSLCLQEVTGSTGERVGHVSCALPNGAKVRVALQAKDNLGEKTGLDVLRGYVVEKITAQELLFTNDFALALGEAASYGMLAEEMQRVIVARAISNHFEREEYLFKRGIKSLSLFFIDAVAKYMPQDGRPAQLRELFEQEFAAQLAAILAKPALHPPYRAYLERTANDVSRVHKGYFARSHSEKGEEEAIRLILKDKEDLLSFDTDLRFIFSMWALQEGWDNPNIFTLCKLAPSHSRISKLQQIGRGLRLAVNQQLERVTLQDTEFDAINELVVVVPESEGDFVEAIQNEIAANSLGKVGTKFDDASLVAFGAAPSTRVAQRVLDAMVGEQVIALNDVSGQATMLMSREEFGMVRQSLLAQLSGLAGMEAEHGQRLGAFFDAYFGGYSQIKRKSANAAVLHPRPEQFAKFKALWEALNRDAVVRYEIDSEALVRSILGKIESDFNITALSVQVKRTEHVHDVNQVEEKTSNYTVKPHALYSLAEFVRELSHSTKLTMATVSGVLAQMPAAKFALIAQNENRALVKLRDLMVWSIYELIVNKISYELREVRVKTALTDVTGALLETIPASACGVENFAIENAAVKRKSLYREAYMPVDSQAEKGTVTESTDECIEVFAKLPKINIPTPVGAYNPDFAYALSRAGKVQALYLIVETKGYDAQSELGRKEAYKIDSAKHFFKALREKGVDVRYHTKLNQDTLAGMILALDQTA